MAQAKKYDFLVIGAGPGGYVAAIRAAQLGMKSAVIEKDRVGGLCLNWGCIPSKALLRSAELYRHFQRAEDYGITVENLGFDLDQVVTRSRQAADRLSKGVEYLFRKNKIDNISGAARITKKGAVEVSSDGKQNQQIEAEHLVVATGGKIRTLPGVEPDGKKIITSYEALVPKSIPKSMIIIGGGPIGVEFAYFYNTFGTKCTVVEMMSHMLPLEDNEITGILRKSFKKQGIEVLTDTRVEGAKSSKTGVKVKVSGKDGEQELEGELALLAVGFSGFTEGLGLEDAGVKLEKGFIKVDEHYHTSADGIYAIGDVIGPPLLAHVASAEGIHLAEHLAGQDPALVDYGNVPSCTYCQPQVASVGLTEEKAKEKGYDLRIGHFPFSANGKSIAIGETEGTVKLIFDNKYGELLGAHIIGSEATDMIAELGVARSLEATHVEIEKTIHAHPTLTEAVMEAAEQAYGEAIHI
jgi:dihydrolipoamide dehydrogenase